MKKFFIFIIFWLGVVFSRNHPNSYVIEQIQECWDSEYPIVFGVLGDNYSANWIFRSIVRQLNSISDSLDFIVAVGDLAAGGDSVGYARYMALIDSLNVPLISVMGNHELNDSLGWERFIEFFGHPDFHFDVGDARFICITNCFPTSEPVSGSENVYYMYFESQLEWLEEKLSEWDGYKFVFIHAPPYLLGHITIATVGGFGSAPDYEESLTEEFTNILRDNDVYICFGGHIHAYDRWTPNNELYGDVTYILTGGAGASIIPIWPYPAPYGGPIYHFLIMELYEDGTINGHLVRPDTIDDGHTIVEYDSLYEFRLYPPSRISAQIGAKPQQEIIVHPNPFNDVLNIYVGGTDNQISIYDISGKLVERISQKSGKQIIRWKPKPDIPGGVYTIKANDSSLKIFYIP
ncbi:hypothetical protein DRQ33_02085 [bacterium]|nr:MAG: hypothetical protein DRQ33_02085 [bacterium]